MQNEIVADMIIAQAKAQKAVNYIMRATAALNDVNLALFPKLRDAVQRLEALEVVLRQPVPEPRKTKLTAFVMTDTREWDDPAVLFIETLSPDYFLDDVKREYWKLYHGEEVVELSPADYWIAEGARVWMVMPGHVQIGSAASGSLEDVDSYAVENAFDESALRVL